MSYKLSMFLWEEIRIISIDYFCDLSKETEWQYLLSPVKGHILVIKSHQAVCSSDSSQSVQMWEDEIPVSNPQIYWYQLISLFSRAERYQSK